MPLTVAIPDLISPSYFPAIAAVELDFFKLEGLDGEIRSGMATRNGIWCPVLVREMTRRAS